MIPYGRQAIDASDLAAVIEVLQSEFLTQGPAVPRFEQAIATYCQAPHALVVNSATSALHMACLALGLGPGGRLWTSPNTFVASANCGLYCGAEVDFVDIDERTFNISVSELARKLELAERLGRLPQVLVAVHFAGQPCDMREIRTLSNRYGFKVIEDASHAIGASYLGRPIGDCEFSDLTVFSFHPVKIVTTGEGGAITVRDPVLAQKLALLRSHGITREPAQMRGGSEGGWYYQQVSLGYNFRMTDIQAALGASQMSRIEEFLERRRALVDRYRTLLAGLPIKLPYEAPERMSAWHLYAVQVEKRADVYVRMRQAGIGVNVHYIPVHLQPYYGDLGFKAGDLPVAEAYYARTLSLPMFPGLTDAQQDQVVDALRAAI